jgi:cytochrome c peroxidase
MHDGSIATLEEVVEHYSRGGLNKCATGKSCGSAPQKNSLIRPLKLTKPEKRALVEFLRSLSTSAPSGK